MGQPLRKFDPGDEPGEDVDKDEDPQSLFWRRLATGLVLIGVGECVAFSFWGVFDFVWLRAIGFDKPTAIGLTVVIQFVSLVVLGWVLWRRIWKQ